MKHRTKGHTCGRKGSKCSQMLVVQVGSGSQSAIGGLTVCCIVHGLVRIAWLPVLCMLPRLKRGPCNCRSALILYRQILDSIEGENDYNNFTKRAYVKKYKKFLSLPSALLKSWA